MRYKVQWPPTAERPRWRSSTLVSSDGVVIDGTPAVAWLKGFEVARALTRLNALGATCSIMSGDSYPLSVKPNLRASY